MQYTSQNIVHVHMPLLRAFIYVTITLAADTSRFKNSVASCGLPHSWRRISVRHTFGFQHFSKQSWNAFHVGTAKTVNIVHMPTSLPYSILMKWRLSWCLHSRHHTAAQSAEGTSEKYQFTVQAWRRVCFAYNKRLERPYIPLLSWVFLKTQLSSF